MTFIRFVIDDVDQDSGRRRGVLQLVYELLDGTTLSAAERDELRKHLNWFRQNLEAPDRFARSRKSRAAPRAISWFKSTAVEHVSRMRQLVNVLRAHDVYVNELVADKAGYIVFEDEHQVAAEPFADTPT